MAITEADLKLLASERMNDDPDGGGFPTGIVIQDNVENNVFPDISMLDRAQGAIDFRKFYPAVLATNVDVYFGAHVIIDQIPADPSVSCLLQAGASVAEQRSQLIATLGAGSRFYATKPLLASVSVGGQVVNVGSLTQRLIPSATVATPSTGQVAPTLGTFTTGSCLVSMGSRGFELAIPPGRTLNGIMARLPILPRAGSVSGSITDVLGTTGVELVSYTSPSDPGRHYEYLKWSASGLRDDTVFVGKNWFYRSASDGDGTAGGNLSEVTASTAQYEAALVAENVPRVIHSFTYTSAMTPVLGYTLPDLSEPASEMVVWQDSLNRQFSMVSAGSAVFTLNSYPGGFPATSIAPSGTINRATGAVTLLLDPPPKVGTEIQTYYTKTGYLASIPFAALAAGGVFSGGEVAVTGLTVGFAFHKAMFKVGSQYYFINKNREIRLCTPSLFDPAPESGTIVGSYDSISNKILIPGMTGTISDWNGIQISTSIPTSSVTGGSIPPSLDPATVTLTGVKIAGGGAWSATADANGTFSTALLSGTYNKDTGALVLNFTEAVSSLINWAGDTLTYTATPVGVTGVNPASFATNGEVTVLKPLDVVVLHNTQSIAPATYANGNDIDTGRTNIADVRLIGNDGNEITSGFTINRITGHVSVDNITGWSQPVTVFHRVEVVATAIAAAANGQVTLSKPAEHVYPSGTSYLSSAYILGDLQGRVRNGFQFQTWAGVWEDAIGSATPILADFNEALFPITTTNKGAIKQRWALIFTNTSSFRVVGEDVGEVAVGDTSLACSPLNPATGSPYFTINPLAWGSGWATGNVYRFNTEAATSPCWLIRSINPSDPFVGQDKVTVSVRGDVNA